MTDITYPHDVKKGLKNKTLRTAHITNAALTGLREVVIDSETAIPGRLFAYERSGEVYVRCENRTLKSVVFGQTGGTRIEDSPKRAVWDYRMKSFSAFSYVSDNSAVIRWKPRPATLKVIKKHTEGMFFHDAPDELKAYIMHLREETQWTDINDDVMAALQSGKARLLPISPVLGACVVVDSDIPLPPAGRGVVTNKGRRLTVVVGNTTLPRLVGEYEKGAYAKRNKWDDRLCHDFRACAFHNDAEYRDERFIVETRKGFCVMIDSRVHGIFPTVKDARTVRNVILGVENG